MDIRVAVRNVDKSNCLHCTWHTHCLDTLNQATATVFNHLIHEFFDGFHTFFFNNFSKHFADHVAAGNTGFLIENPVFGRTNIALTFVQIVTQRGIVDTCFATADLNAITKTLDLAI